MGYEGADCTDGFMGNPCTSKRNFMSGMNKCYLMILERGRLSWEIFEKQSTLYFWRYLSRLNGHLATYGRMRVVHVKDITYLPLKETAVTVWICLHCTWYGPGPWRDKVLRWIDLTNTRASRKLQVFATLVAIYEKGTFYEFLQLSISKDFYLGFLLILGDLTTLQFQIQCFILHQFIFIGPHPHLSHNPQVLRLLPSLSTVQAVVVTSGTISPLDMYPKMFAIHACCAGNLSDDIVSNIPGTR